MNVIYQIDWNKLPVILLPTFLRKQKQIAWLKSLFQPIKNIHSQFLDFRSKSNYKIDHTSQTGSIEQVLNDAHDQGERRIYIVDVLFNAPVYFYNPEEDAPVHFYNSNENEEHPRFFNESEVNVIDSDFVVILPLEFQNTYYEGSSSMIRLKALIDFYRLPDKAYKIEFE